MQEPGYIYAMVNQSIEGLVKIGKTTREPEARAKELSQATGVATPFYVAFSIVVSDCNAAEEFAHAVLEHNGFRYTPNREFFQVSLQQAIQVLMMTEMEFQKKNFAIEISGTQRSDEHLSTRPEVEPEEIEEHPGRAVFSKAWASYYGFRDELKDIDEGVRLLNSAKALNYPAAFTSLACHYTEQAKNLQFESDELDNGAISKNRNSALETLKEGAAKGHARCWVALAQFYADGKARADGQPDPESARKCWKRYFQSDTFRFDDDTRWTESEIGILDDKLAGGWDRSYYIQVFLEAVAAGQVSFDRDIKTLLIQYPNDLQVGLRAVNEFHNCMANPSFQKLLHMMKSQFLDDLQVAIMQDGDDERGDYARSCQELVEFLSTAQQA